MRLYRIMKLVGSIECKEPYCDVGCSNGFITNKIVSKFNISNASGCDHNRDNLKVASQNYPEIVFNYINLNVINISSERYRLVTCFETLEHVGHLHNAIINLLSLTEKNGTLLITVPVETGLVGLLKFVIKTVFFRYSLKEFSFGRTIYFKYLFSLITGGDISSFRGCKPGYGTHFGFDYQKVEDALGKAKVNYNSYKYGTTLFYLINSTGD
jgi:ubiquinone/menaquinone biosynthesis C-methylase UbiE